MRDEINALYIPHHVMLTSRIILLPLFVTTLSLGTVFAPRQAGTWEFLKMSYEAYAFYAFYNLLIHYAGGPRALVADLSQRKHNIQIWAPNVSPCRCFIICYKIRRCDIMYNAPDVITYHNFKLAEKFVLQFCMLVPVFSVILIIIKESMLLETAMFISTVVCMYGLFIFMDLTHEVCAERGVSTHGKFVAMKVAIVFSSLLMTVLSFFLHTSYCGYDAHIITEAYGATISSFAMIPLAFMMKRVFPVEELEVCHMAPMDNPLGHPDTKTQADYEAQAASKIKGGKHSKEKRQSTIRNDAYAGSAGYDGILEDRFASAEDLGSRDVEADPLAEPVEIRRMSSAQPKHNFDL
ncbi:hypothetical protein CYMTET_55515 [Cymbomonas tetramitiformis]|uniref:Uncharacterized protein n=1 Tax=Cymbomonas tetramitiformis TaxID=36881 RepID=A0AAE0BDZ5_9CHLO|nr:hypothetical protein CYMTET_55515 [Cymbomonas tetramitiformis]